MSCDGSGRGHASPAGIGLSVRQWTPDKQRRRTLPRGMSATFVLYSPPAISHHTTTPPLWLYTASPTAHEHFYCLQQFFTQRESERKGSTPSMARRVMTQKASQRNSQQTLSAYNFGFGLLTTLQKNRNGRLKSQVVKNFEASLIP